MAKALLNATLRFSPTILRLLGEELNPSPDQGIIELAKNAYDADAKECVVTLNGVRERGGSIRVVDTGDGLLPEQIMEGWLILGQSQKRTRKTSRGGRLLVGNKGLGRLAALRLGGLATLISRPRSLPAEEFVVELNWEAYEGATAVEGINIPIRRRARSSKAGYGTEILIERIRTPWTNLDVERLARGLMLLTDPFGDENNFRPRLVADEFQALQKLADKSYLQYYDYHVEAGIDTKGFAYATMQGDDRHYDAKHTDLVGKGSGEPFHLRDIKLNLWEFRIDPGRANFGLQGVKKTDMQRWLKSFGGVSIYHRGVRVSPYGDEGNDWLDMNLGRARSPEHRPSTNNSIARIIAPDRDHQLKQKTDRLGFVDDENFQELRLFAKNVLDWMQDQRLAERKRRQAAEKKIINKRLLDADTQAKAAIADMPAKYRARIKRAVSELKKVHAEEVKLLLDENLLYHTLGTVGTTASAFAHQTKVPLKVIHNSSNLLRDLLGNSSLPSFPQMSEDAVARIGRAADALLSFTSVTLRLLEHEKRRPNALDVHALINGTVEMLEPFLKYRHTTVVCDYAHGPLRIRASQAAFEAILTNLISNSLQAFAQPVDENSEVLEEPVPAEPRRIVFRTAFVPEGNRIRLTVMDNGPGIQGLSVEEIWRPGKTTTVRGTGLGLTIVRDIITEMRGTINAQARGELGGAQFNIDLPAC